MSRPQNKIVPSSAESLRYTSCSSVLLPEPLGPVMNTNSPRSIFKFTPRSVGTSGVKYL